MLTPAQSARTERRIRLLPSCDNLECRPAILSEDNFCCVVAIVATEPKTAFPVILHTKPHVLNAGEIAAI